MDNKNAEPTFTIAEITQILKNKMPEKFESPGEKGNPELFLPHLLRLNLRDVQPMEYRHTLGRNGHPMGPAARAFALSDLKVALQKTSAELKKDNRKILPNTQEHFTAVVNAFIGEYERG